MTLASSAVSWERVPVMIDQLRQAWFLHISEEEFGVSKILQDMERFNDPQARQFLLAIVADPMEGKLGIEEIVSAIEGGEEILRLNGLCLFLYIVRTMPDGDAMDFLQAACERVFTAVVQIVGLCPKARTQFHEIVAMAVVYSLNWSPASRNMLEIEYVQESLNLLLHRCVQREHENFDNVFSCVTSLTGAAFDCAQATTDPCMKLSLKSETWLLGFFWSMLQPGSSLRRLHEDILRGRTFPDFENPEQAIQIYPALLQALASLTKSVFSKAPDAVADRVANVAAWALNHADRLAQDLALLDEVADLKALLMEGGGVQSNGDFSKKKAVQKMQIPKIQRGRFHCFAVSCSFCGKWSTQGTSALQKCSKCHTARYCDQVCQAGHWPAHKKLCRSLRKFRA